MADRKRTPDVLAELLSADLPAPDLPAAPPAAPQPAEAPAPVTWEVEIVSFQDHRGWRPRDINGKELKDWLAGSLVHDYANQRGAEGWELAGTSAADHFYGVSDSLQLYFKRRK